MEELKLGERFGSDAVITQVHLDKLAMFPKSASRDNKGLQEQADPLLELQCAKRDGELTGLQIYDQPAFLKPLVIKLPEDLPGKVAEVCIPLQVPARCGLPPVQ